MEFKTVDEMIKYINQETEFRVVDKDELEKMAPGKIPYIYTSEGKEKLKAKGYFTARYIYGRVGFVFNRFRCDGCTERKIICKKCRAIKTIIKSL